jgi:hypothetical protein
LDDAIEEALSLLEGAEDAQHALVQDHLDRLIAWHAEARALLV